jgi:hypothetical protein
MTGSWVAGVCFWVVAGPSVVGGVVVGGVVVGTSVVGVVPAPGGGMTPASSRRWVVVVVSAG